MVDAGTRPDATAALSRSDFDRWYDRFSDDLAEPARLTVDRLLRSLLAEELEPHDSVRIKVSASRVKAGQRLWDKLQRLEAMPVAASDIPDVIDDIVGLRIVCNNTSDIPRVQELLAQIGTEAEDPSKPWCIVPDSEKQYHERPKDSGYRAYHLNVLVQVPAYDGWRRVSAEIQVRTLLQDAWGELTHEDTYKPGADLPPLASTLARRMADLLAAVDAIAEDIRRELDRVLQDSLGERDEDDSNQSGPASSRSVAKKSRSETEVDFSVDEAKEEIVRYADSLERPVTLAAAAHHMQTVFGAAISDDWFGFESFKRFVLDALPESRVRARIPGHLLPVGYEESGAQDGPDATAPPKSVPTAIADLKRYDPSVPAHSKQDMSKVTKALAQLLRQPKWATVTENSVGTPGLKEVNQISRVLRDEVTGLGVDLSRSESDYMVKGLLFSGHLRPDLSVAAVRSVTASRMVQATRELGLSSDLIGDQKSIRNWLSVSPP